jgi:excisionase family DNA binding protein
VRATRSSAGAAQPRSAADEQLPEPTTTSGPRSTNGSLLFADDVAAMVGMTKDWIYAETRAGRIPHVSLGRYYRYRPESIDAWLREIERGSMRARHIVERR